MEEAAEKIPKFKITYGGGVRVENLPKSKYTKKLRVEAVWYLTEGNQSVSEL